MLVGIIKNNDNSYEYIDMIGKRLYCTHLDNNGFSRSDIKHVKNILNKLFYNRDCTFLKKYKEYDVYYDKETGLKHFIKDNKESLELFYIFNCNDDILYKDSIDNNSKNSKILKRLSISLAGCVVLLNIGSMIIGNSLNNEYAAINDFEINTAINNIYSSEEINEMYQRGNLTYKDAISYIYESDINEEIKPFLANEELLQDIFSYYKGTPLEYSAYLKFNNITIQYRTIEKKGTLGAYNQMEPNIIYITDLYTENPSVNEYNQYILNKNIYIGEETKLDVIGHEYIHLLQAEGSPWQYIEEASAELLAYEYLNTNITSYYNGIKNLKLLIEIIGPEPIMKMLFSGDDDELNNIIKNNLSKEQSTELIAYLQDASVIDNDYQGNCKIRDLLCILYKNIYGKDISQDPNILYELRYANYKYDNEDPFMYEPRWFLNINKINQDDKYPIFELDLDSLLECGIIDKKTSVLYRKSISLEEYNMLIKDDNNKYSIGFNVTDNKGTININEETEEVTYIDEYGNTYSLEQATNKELISINISQTIDSNSQDIKKIEQEGWTAISETSEYSSKFSTIDISNPEVLVISTESIGSRENFSNQIKNMNDRKNSHLVTKKHNL